MPAKKTSRNTKSTKVTPQTKAAKTAPVPKKKLSALDAAVVVLAEKGTSMTTQELIGAMAAKGLWTSPNGRTPAATLYAALLREITLKGKDSRFQKTAPGRFAATGNTVPTDEKSAKKGAKKKNTPKKARKKATAPATAEGPAVPETTEKIPAA